MGGDLEVQSEVGKGSRFFFEIPFAPYESKVESSALDAQESTGIIGNAHVLIVEDNVSNQTLLGTILQEAGVTYDVANDGEEGLRRFRQRAYDLIFMDENMPKKNGLAATAEIRHLEQTQEKTKTPIIAVTANALLGDKQRFLNAGVDDYIAKPYRDEEILAVLRKFLG
jgi:two-component system, sensor histidine kinase